MNQEELVYEILVLFHSPGFEILCFRCNNAHIQHIILLVSVWNITIGEPQRRFRLCLEKNESRSLCSLTGNICWPRADSLCSWFRHQKHHEAFMMNHLNRNELVPLNAMTPKIKLRAPQHLLASATRLSTHGRGSFTCRETMFDPQQMVPVVFDPY